MGKELLARDDSRVLIHFDYDCFYASVVENEHPALKALPLAIQQKQIIVTCNYEARRRGLRKLQLITEAKKVCPDVVIILGEDLTRFRRASKELYNWLRARVWSDRAERLGFDEVWLDVTDMVEYNLSLVNRNDPFNSFFCIDADDPTTGFKYDASKVVGPTFPAKPTSVTAQKADPLLRRLVLGSHLAVHLRHELEKEKGYTATVGIATNKILSKLVGNVNKPHNQTTLVPPYENTPLSQSSVTTFIDAHDIGRIPGIGFKLSQKIRAHVLGRPAIIHEGLIYGGTRESVCVQDVRSFPGMGPELLEEILSGPGSQKGIGGKMWQLLHGVDDAEVSKAKRVPTQISQEDSYMRYLRNFDDVRTQLLLLAERLLVRMHLDLMEDDEDDETMGETKTKRRWLAHPRTLRLSTRPRPSPTADGIRARTFHRISRSAPFPNFAFSLNDNVSALAERMVEGCLIPMFRQLHPQQTSFNLSLINIACTNMAETAADTKESDGRDIGRMFRKQDDVLKDFRISESTEDDISSLDNVGSSKRSTDPSSLLSDDNHNNDDEKPLDDAWDDEDEDEDTWPPSDNTPRTDSADSTFECHICNITIPAFASQAHLRFHDFDMSQ